MYKAHRIAWYLHYGEWPEGMIDHVNRNKNDNRIENLRLVSNRYNQHNTNKFNSGAYWYPKLNKWRAQIGLENRTITLGYFEFEADAQRAYLMKLKEIEANG